MNARLAETHDIPGVLGLQDANLYENLTESERKRGFVTTPFTRPQLQELIDLRGLFVVELDRRIAGYAMAADWGYFSQWPIFPYMVSRFADLTFEGEPISAETSFQYGPVCIEASLRGTPAFPYLFEEMRIEFSSRRPVGLTFINKANDRSYKAHVNKIGMAVVDEFHFSGRDYYSLAFDTGRSVLPAARA